MIFADSYSNTIAGAIAPVITAVGLGIVGIIGHRINKRLDAHNDVAVDSLQEVKSTIRDDLANGIKYRLDTLEDGQRQLFEGQGEIMAKIDNLEDDPPSTLA